MALSLEGFAPSPSKVNAMLKTFQVFAGGVIIV